MLLKASHYWVLNIFLAFTSSLGTSSLSRWSRMEGSPFLLGALVTTGQVAEALWWNYLSEVFQLARQIWQTFTLARKQQASSPGELSLGPNEAISKRRDELKQSLRRQGIKTEPQERSEQQGWMQKSACPITTTADVKETTRGEKQMFLLKLCKFDGCCQG